MIEARLDLWSVTDGGRCITTNGAVRKDGAAVMGRGCAAEAVQHCPGIEYELGLHLKLHGNHVHLINYYEELALVSFPVKHHWREVASIDLIQRSCRELTELVDETWGYSKFYLPRPGCGNGQLDWQWVKPKIENLLDDRFVVIDR